MSELKSCVNESCIKYCATNDNNCFYAYDIEDCKKYLSEKPELAWEFRWNELRQIIINENNAVPRKGLKRALFLMDDLEKRTSD